MAKKSVVPTHVGVNLLVDMILARDLGCPHACGGEPYMTVISGYLFWLSPRMWG